MKLTWDLPAGNPRVDGYTITVRQVRAAPPAPAPSSLSSLISPLYFASSPRPSTKKPTPTPPNQPAQTNATGYPLASGSAGDATLKAAADAEYIMARNLKPKSYYAFIIQVGGAAAVRQSAVRSRAEITQQVE